MRFFIWICIIMLSCTTFCCTTEKVKIGDIIGENDNMSYTIVFFATWDAESVIKAKTIGSQFLEKDSLILVSLDDYASITEEMVDKNNLGVYYDTLVYYKDNPKFYNQFIDSFDVFKTDISAYFVQNGRIKMLYTIQH